MIRAFNTPRETRGSETRDSQSPQSRRSAARFLMLLPNLSPQRMLAVGVALFLVILFFFASFHQSPSPIQVIKESAAGHICPGTFADAQFSSLLPALYKSIRHPIDAKTYTDPTGRQFSVSENPTWTKPLGKQVLIVDMDTRIPDGNNELWNPATMNYETLDAHEGSQMVSAAFMNHFIYSQIHGYDYKFFAAHHLKNHHDTWIKPHVVYDMLQDYRFVIFIDADATVQHLELPMEWLFNRWDITPNTSIAMPIDTAQKLNGNDQVSMDSRGKITANTGVIIAQNLPHTMEMMKAWRDCTKGKKYPDCGQWKEQWSHEQRAFSEYIRYDYNPNNNIVEIPCDEAMGYPGLKEKNGHIISNCTGQFLRHHTIDKAMTKESGGNALIQSMVQLVQNALQSNHDDYWVTDSMSAIFMDKITGGK